MFAKTEISKPYTYKAYRAKEKSDIIICQIKANDLEIEMVDQQKFNSNLRLGLIPDKKTFSSLEITKNIFQFCKGWAWDKLFRTDFILTNKIKFPNITNFNEYQFTYSALYCAKSITILKQKLYLKK